MDRRWDNDTKGVGARDGTPAAESVEHLLDTLGMPGWVAEEPEVHLLPHVERTLEELGVPLLSAVVVNGVLELVVALGDRPRTAARYVAFALVASFAETSTHVREVEQGVFEVVTGMLPGDGDFAPHGHLVTIRLRADEPGDGATGQRAPDGGSA
jgi:hypothetical protein